MGLTSLSTFSFLESRLALNLYFGQGIAKEISLGEDRRDVTLHGGFR